MHFWLSLSHLSVAHSADVKLLILDVSELFSLCVHVSLALGNGFSCFASWLNSCVAGWDVFQTCPHVDPKAWRWSLLSGRPMPNYESHLEGCTSDFLHTLTACFSLAGQIVRSLGECPLLWISFRIVWAYLPCLLWSFCVFLETQFLKTRSFSVGKKGSWEVQVLEFEKASWGSWDCRQWRMPAVLLFGSLGMSGGSWDLTCFSLGICTCVHTHAHT